MTAPDSPPAFSGKTGVLLVNLGSPDAPDTPPVRNYLRQFLSDSRVIDLPAPARFLLLNLVILPFRSPRSAHAYRQIWMPEGSPLVVHTRNLTRKVAAELDRISPGKHRVLAAMRYGNPSLKAALDHFREEGIHRIFLLPLFPQYATATTGSLLAEIYRLAVTRWDPPELTVLPPFFAESFFTDAVAARGRDLILTDRPDHIVFSFHGIPERQIRKSDPDSEICRISDGCCSEISERNFRCYRAACFETARQIAGRLNLQPGTWTVAFQSRLGRTKWIEPYTDRVIRDLAGKGHKRVLVFSPSFVADCLETLEEIGLRLNDEFLSCGGSSLTLVPSLNDGDDWAAGLAGWISSRIS
ncbi:MAG: ferrochelatase [Bacteroidetes bacterium]|nr:ferrochelatase [Bacteroidota bacterium]